MLVNDHSQTVSNALWRSTTLLTDKAVLITYNKLVKSVSIIKVVNAWPGVMWQMLGRLRVVLMRVMYMYVVFIIK